MLTGATFQCHFPLIVANTVLDLALGLILIWQYPEQRSNDENILQLPSLANKFEMFGSGQYETILSLLRALFIAVFSF